MFDKIIVGGGIFGSYAALKYAKLGYTVALVEKESTLLNRASKVNQARLHTGLHYPRSFLTAKSSAEHFHNFRKNFPQSVFEFSHIYGISSENSKTSNESFKNFAGKLEVRLDEINPEDYFLPGTIDGAFKISEPTFDVENLRSVISTQIKESSGIHQILNSNVTDGDFNGQNIELQLNNADRIVGKELVIATYASTNIVRRLFDLEELPLTYELTEVILGLAGGNLQNMGFTIMDGPFWSMMPFGATGLSSLTCVGITPVMRSLDAPRFSCQDKRPNCTPENLQNCDDCNVKPRTSSAHQVQQMKKFLTHADDFTPNSSLHTIKTILRVADADDARPTIILQEKNMPITTIFSGKLSTIFDLDEVLV